MKHLFKHVAACALSLLLTSCILAADCNTCCDTSCTTCCTSSCNTCCDTSCNSCCNTTSCCDTSCCNTSCCDTSCGTSCSNGCCGTCNSGCCNSCCDTDFVSCKSHFTPRSQGLDNARLNVDRHHRIHLADKEDVYGSFDVALAYQRSFSNDRLAKYISPNCCTAFTVGANGESGTTLRNHDFGLECTGCVTLCPIIQSFVADLEFFVGLNSWLEGLYIDFQLPVVHTWWDPKCCISNTTTCGDDFEEFLMSTDPDKNSSVKSICDGLNGTKIWGDVKNTMCYGKICCGKNSETRLADLRFRIGYDFWLKEDYFFGLKLVTAAPTGNTPKACYLWEPIAGNGGHWELGGGLTAKAVLWDKDEDSRLTWFLDTEITHMFTSREHKRTFDLCSNGCYSRYLLLKKFQASSTAGADPTLDGLVRGPNVFTQCVKTQINVQAEVTTFFSFFWNQWIFDLGYDGWFRSEEKLKCFCPCIPANTYGIKGEQPMADDEDTENLTTASESTIKTAGDEDASTTYISSNSLNSCSALHPSAISHSVFGHVAYVWEDNDWAPSIGIGAKGEFSGRGNRAASQWQVWGKGGIAF